MDELRFIVAVVKQFSHLIVQSPDPTMALANFERLVERIDPKAREIRRLRVENARPDRTAGDGGTGPAFRHQ